MLILNRLLLKPYKKFSFIALMLKSALTEGRKKS